MNKRERKGKERKEREKKEKKKLMAFHISGFL